MAKKADVDDLTYEPIQQPEPDLAAGIILESLRRRGLMMTIR